jgi:hypothetical protein
MQHRWFGIVLVSAALCPMVAPAAIADTATCRQYIAKRAQILIKKTIYHEVKCHRRRMLGLEGATVDCNDPGSVGFPAASVTKLSNSAATFTTKVTAKCTSFTPAGLGYTSCPSPCTADVPTIVDMPDVAACGVCLAESLASVAITTAYGTNPPLTATKTAAWTCQNTRAGSGMYAYSSTRMNQQRACQYKEDKGTIGATDCKNADLRGFIAKAATNLAAKIAKCTDADLAALTSCGASVASEQTCVRLATVAAADSLFDFVYPAPPPTATPTVTSTGTLTPTTTTTPTRTPTATATPTTAGSSCPSSIFLDVTGAAGPGGSYSSFHPSLSVSCSSTTVTVQSNGIPTYQYVAMTPNGLQAKSYNFSFPLSPAVAGSTTSVPLLGNVGVAVNGIPIYGPNEATQPASDAYGDPIAATLLDQCGSHSGNQGSFHNHTLQVKCLIQSAVSSSQPWNNPDPSPSNPSPIVGYAFDGFPIYGPYECTDGGCGAVQEMLSSWDNSGYQSGTLGCTSSAACSNGYCTEVMINGTPTTACVPRTCVWSNNTYTAKAGSQYLDQCNGHVGPNGDYHYHTTPTFPYILACYRGTPTTNGGNGTPPGGTCP